MRIVTYPNPVLTTIALPYEIGEYVTPVIDGMRELIKASWRTPTRAVGLAAPQVGVGRRLFIMQPANESIVCINPVITWSNMDTSIQTEGCMSLPGFSAKVERAKSIEVEFLDAQFELQKRTFDGMYARIFQHELDHLNGRLINGV